MPPLLGHICFITIYQDECWFLYQLPQGIVSCMSIENKIFYLLLRKKDNMYQVLFQTVKTILS